MTLSVAGGSDAEHVATSGVEQYDPVKDEWRAWETPLTKKLSGHHLLNVVFYSSGYLDNLSKPDWIPYIEKPLTLGTHSHRQDREIPLDLRLRILKGCVHYAMRLDAT